jgi:hypothetical protein
MGEKLYWQIVKLSSKIQVQKNLRNVGQVDVILFVKLHKSSSHTYQL